MFRKYLLKPILYAAGAYQIIAIAACLKHKLARRPAATRTPVSVLKPVHGLDDGFYEAIRSQAEQTHPEFEILFGVSDPEDPAVGPVRRLAAEFPNVRLEVCSTRVPNGKVGVLIDLARLARHEIFVVNDSDIKVDSHYLEEVTAPLAQSNIGLVTCLYRAEASDWPGRWEALAIATDFAPSTLVAPLFGVSEFGLGSTLAFRRADLDRAGGFEAVSQYLADDYRIGCMLHGQGFRNVISHVVVSTGFSKQSWTGAWRHQLRWARTIRLSRGAGYVGLPITFASVWSAVAFACGAWRSGLLLLAIRMTMAITCGWFVLRSRDVLQYWYAIPLRDVSGAVVWAAALFGRTVQWRDQKLMLDHQGRIQSWS